MREAFGKIDKRIIFRETFNSEQDTRRNGGVPTDVDYSNGVGSFNGDSTIIQYPVIQIPTSCSIRVKVKANSTIDSNKRGLMGKFFNTDGEGFNSIAFDGEAFSFYATNGNNRSFTGYSKETWYEGVFVIEHGTQKFYANGVLNGSTWSENISGNYNLKCIGDIDSDGSTSRQFDGDIELIEIYEGTLTAEEVKNLYENKTYHELPDKIEEQLGDNIISNGDFSNGANNWTKDSTWVIADGKATYDGVGGTFEYIRQDVNGIGNTIYRLKYEVFSHTTGNLILSSAFTGTTINLVNTVGKHEIDIYLPTNDTDFLIGSGNPLFIGSIGNIELIPIISGTGIEKILDVSATQGVLENKMSGDKVQDVSFDKYFSNWNVLGAPESSGYLTVTFDGYSNIRLSGILTAGKRYRFKVKGTISDGVFRLRDYSGTDYYLNNISGPKFEEVTEFTAIDAGLRLRSDSGSGVLTFTQFDIEEIVPELSPTDVGIKKIGNYYTPDFNGATSKIDCGNFDPLTGDITVLVWVNLKILINYPHILSNGEFRMFLSSAGKAVVRSDDTTNGTSSNDIYELKDSYNFIAAKRYASGLVDFYNHNGLVGSDDSGTPSPGTTNLIIGDYTKAIGSNPYNGKIPRTVIYKGLLSPEQISQFYSNTRRLYE